MVVVSTHICFSPGYLSGLTSINKPKAAYTVNTLIVISVLAIVMGIVFGTYPAMRASRLDPVEAIRRE